ncbi:glycosyltransferase [Microvirga sp. ACRRW]|uniref:glycosyltransferase n=1 Tax=Microvirga sp. ACRRW TaxID=2918205 RepID=UPI001EF66403|nr:glycosyltransferase [Microvirga sp. ACRRW]MCG7394825.1 glycosyltransferase [Microvirga sp. ACRRW]
MKQGLAEQASQSTVLPVEIGFLARHGYPPRILRDAAMIAELTGVFADEVLLKSGQVGEVEFYRALAAELSLPFLSNPPLSRAARHPESIMTGLAPLAVRSGGFVVAPRGRDLVRILQGRFLAVPLAVTAPSLLRDAVFRIHSGMIAHRAALELHHAAPALSNYKGASIAQIAGTTLAALILSSSFVAFPNPTIMALSMTLSILFLCLVVLRLAASILSNPLQPITYPPRAPDSALPIYTIIVPLYRERRIASRLIAALKRLDYPTVKLDIKIVLEADDGETISILRRLRLPANVEIIVAPPGEPRTKPRALNVALPLARGRYTVVYDAEDMPEPAQLRLACSAFSRQPRNVACLQARLTIDNTDDSWITRLFTIEYAALFDVFNPGLAQIGSPIPLGGTSNHFRTAIIRKIHGWDAWNVTEDADLGIRLARFGYDVADLPSSTFEEAPGTFKEWMGQRTRWMKGFMQTSIAHGRNPTSTLSQLGFWRFYAGMALMAGTVLSALIYPFCMGFLITLWITGTSWSSSMTLHRIMHAQSLSLFTFGMMSLFIPALVALHRRRLWRLLPWTILLPLYYGLVSLAAWRGLWELIVAPSRWNKTSHGLARTSRSGMLQKHHANVVRTRSLKIAPP